jgi:hypothetical protein
MSEKKERLELDAGDRITEAIETRRAETRIAGLGRAGSSARAIERDPTEGRGTPIVSSTNATPILGRCEIFR